MSDSRPSPSHQDVALTLSPANFETRKIQRLGDDTLLIKPTIGAMAFSLMFFVLGFILVGLWFANTFASFNSPGSVPLSLIGLVFCGAGLGLYYSGNEQLIINRETGVAYLHSWHPSVSPDTAKVTRHIEADDIISLQLVSRIVKRRSNKSRRLNSYTEYQINLCTTDGERHNVIKTLKLKKAEELGHLLARIFDVPLVNVLPDQ
jgi:hypothetical protein